MSAGYLQPGQKGGDLVFFWGEEQGLIIAPWVQLRVRLVVKSDGVHDRLHLVILKDGGSHGVVHERGLLSSDRD
jgi:hypothetical protein